MQLLVVVIVLSIKDIHDLEVGIDAARFKDL